MTKAEAIALIEGLTEQEKCALLALLQENEQEQEAAKKGRKQE